MSRMLVPSPHRHLWHAMSAREVLAALESGEAGLSAEEANQRRAQNGRNELPQLPTPSPLARVTRALRNPLSYVLLGVSVLAFLLGDVFDGSILLGLVLFNALLSALQEARSNRAFQALSKVVPLEATVSRGGQSVTVPAADLVPGDIVTLQAGGRVPADLRLLSSWSVRVEQAALTGESLPVDKHPDPAPPEASLGDRHNLLYSGTRVTYGAAVGVVVATGSATELSRMATLLQRPRDAGGALSRFLTRYGRWLSLSVGALALALAVLGLARGYPLADVKLSVITLALGALPLSLPTLVTLALILSAWRLAKQGVLVRRLAATERLGEVSAFIFNKTGSLTFNEMTVKTLWTPTQDLWVSGDGYAPQGQLLSADRRQVRTPSSNARDLLVAGVLSSSARLYQDKLGWYVDGDPLEGALVAAAKKGGLNANTLWAHFPRLDALPFKAWRGFTATSHGAPGGYGLILLRGSLEEVLRRCSVQSDGGALDGPEGGLHTVRIEQAAASLKNRGMRVLAFAERQVPEPAARILTSDVTEGFTFLGLVGFLDPPRPEAVTTLDTLRASGLSLKMVTGDRAETARLVGAELGLSREGDRVVTGQTLDALDETALQDLVRPHTVFARLTPEHKVRVVRALQAEGHAVAVTGDGVNDAPALQQADVGFAMGVAGTSVAKASADAVLTTDRFTGVLSALEEGQQIRNTLRRLLAFLLPMTLALLLVTALAAATSYLTYGDLRFPLLPMHVLWVHLLVGLGLGVPLLLEPRAVTPTPRSLEDARGPLLTHGLAGRVVRIALLLTVGTTLLSVLHYTQALRAGETAEAALRQVHTVAVNAVLLVQCAYLLHCRSLYGAPSRPPRHPWAVVGIALVLLLQLGFTYLPEFQAVFRSAPLGLDAWLEVALLASGVLLWASAETWWARRRARRTTPPQGVQEGVSAERM